MRNYYVRKQQDGSCVSSLLGKAEQATTLAAVELQVWGLCGSHHDARKFLEVLQELGFAEVFR